MKKFSTKKSAVTLLTLCALLVCGAAHAGVFSVYASQAGVKYIDQDGVEQTRTEYTELVSTEAEVTLNDGWYVVKGESEINQRIEIDGSAHIIVAENSFLTAKTGIELTEGNSLHIYAQSNAPTSGLQCGENSSSAPFSGIGSSGDEKAGALTVNGGMISANGFVNCAAIEGSLTVNGGIVNVTGGDGAEGISADSDLDGSEITVNGGLVVANGGEGAAAIRGDITVDGGIVIAEGHNKNHIIGISEDTPSVKKFITGIVFEGSIGRLYGDNYTLTQNLDILDHHTLIIEKGSSLTVADGYTLTNDGTMINMGTLSGNIQNKGAIYTLSESPVAKMTLIYNGSPQELITKGISDRGALEYSLDGDNWSEHAPTATNAGSYTVYYRICESEQVSTDPIALTAVIEKKTVTVTANSITVEQYTALPELTYSYDGFIGEDTAKAAPEVRVNISDTHTVGEYDISLSGGDGGDNYKLEFVGARLSITEHTECRGGSAVCGEALKCELCGKEYGEPVTHDMSDATCLFPKTCKRCGYIEGGPSAHSYDSACDTKCIACSEARATDEEHTDKDKNRLCDKCGARISVNNDLPIGIIIAMVLFCAAALTLVEIAIIKSVKKKG